MAKQNQSQVYLLYGVEPYLIQENKDKIIKQALKKEDREFNVSQYDLEEIPVEDVVTDAETFPFLGDGKVVIANNPVFLKAKPDKLSFEHDVDVLLQYIQNPAEYTTLVLIAPYEKLDERKKLFKELKKHGAVVHCEPVKEWNMDKWIASLARDLHITVPEDIYELFTQEIGANLMALRNEMEKLALYVGEGGVVTKEAAEQLLSHSAEASGLKLVDAVMERDLGKAIRIYKDLEKVNEEPIALTALLSSQFRIINQAKVLKQKGYAQNQMKTYIKAHPYVIKMALKRERYFSNQELNQIMNELAETDYNLKQGKMEKALAFEMLLYRLIHIKQQTSDAKASI
ncbi:DNA polymerase III subunit delta [Halobacillus litoralis]|uniref:DNA polymerase III subunit delta n=1 Tax=Halobacillus litoralis TaxID=45668 RepID=A0A845DR09_9BACI|nr:MULTISPECIES: DNA polymerase III subunit delta [Halobacillus]MCA1021446.1 DNA polymerase III subunit delta [Halobacillus litoralis]MYL19836.1 DNA polymerase III subunit delta [Halobacillus litoralis]MYL28982.1 DNA polymerase III subunit delta [Halobacillus halophilus]MYL37233.1 DNA polymerase III subunit delta [Halobacillus litoralis]